MNIFRLIGDLSHQGAILLLILQLCRAKNARGTSLNCVGSVLLLLLSLVVVFLLLLLLTLLLRSRLRLLFLLPLLLPLSRLRIRSALRFVPVQIHSLRFLDAPFHSTVSRQQKIKLLRFQSTNQPTNKQTTGISLKTQELRLLVFCTRYLDLFTLFYSTYNTIAKLAYIVSTAGIVVTIKHLEPWKGLYNFEQDSFPHWKWCAAPCFALASLSCLVRYEVTDGHFSVMELLWRFSIYLESVAILPQLVVLRRYGLVEKLTGRFLLLLGTYRFWYILNWWYRYSTESYYRHHYEVYICGFVQVGLFADYFYQYCRVSRWCNTRSGDRGGNDDHDDNDNDNDNDDVDDEALVFEMSREDDARGGGTILRTRAVAQPLLLETDLHDGDGDGDDRDRDDARGRRMREDAPVSSSPV